MVLATLIIVYFSKILFNDKVTVERRSGKKKSFENHSSVSWNTEHDFEVI